MFDQRKKPLPEWFVRPNPKSDTKSDQIQMSLFSDQMSLFQIRLKDMLARLRVSTDTIAKWHAEGWVSINGSEDIVLNESDDPRVFEILFVRDVVRSGLSEAQIKYIFSMLPKPFAFNPKTITFSFKYGWVEVMPPKDPTTHIEEVLEAELSRDGPSRLEELRDWIDELLAGYNNLPYPGSELYWMPTEEGYWMLTIQCPEGLTEIEDLEHYLSILQRNLQWTIQESNEPEWEVEQMLESLEEAGLIDPYLDKKALAAGSNREWEELFQRPDLRTRIKQMLGEAKFPLIPKPSQEAAELFQEISLPEWAQSVARILM